MREAGVASRGAGKCNAFWGKCDLIVQQLFWGKQFTRETSESAKEAV